MLLSKQATKITPQVEFFDHAGTETQAKAKNVQIGMTIAALESALGEPTSRGRDFSRWPDGKSGVWEYACSDGWCTVGVSNNSVISVFANPVIRNAAGYPPVQSQFATPSQPVIGQ